MCDFIDHSTLPIECEPYIRNPAFLIGKRVQHRFLDEEGGTTWYSGTITGYLPNQKTHRVEYDEESGHYDFDLILDLLVGDLCVV